MDYIGGKDPSGNITPIAVDADGHLLTTPDEAASEPFDANIASSALAVTTTSTGGRKVASVTFHFSASYSGTITITLDDNEGANYDTVLLTDTVSSVDDYVWYPDGELPLVNGDQLLLEATAQAATHVYGTVRTQGSG